MARKLITTAGRKQVIGRPILYKTTKDFLLRFGLKDINELPSIEEFEKMAGELAEQEEIPMAYTRQRLLTRSNGRKTRPSLRPTVTATRSARLSPTKLIVDGRISGLPPNYDADEMVEGEDSPALDAEIQSGQRRDSEEG